MKCKWYQFHKWENIKVQSKENFLGETIDTLEHTKYRICKRCKLVQEYTYAYDSQSGTYYYISEDKAKILRDKIDENYILHVTIKPPKDK